MSSSWRHTKLGELSKKLVNGGTPPTEVERFWSGKIPWVTGADFTASGIGEFRRFVSTEAIAQTTTNVIERGQLLVVTRTGVGKLAIAPCDIAISQDITGVYVDKDQTTAAFLFYRLRLGMEDLKKLNQGTSINGVVRSDLIKYPIDLPPIPQQHQIAEILSTLDETIEQTEALIAKQQQIKVGLMHDLFTRGVTPDGQLRSHREAARHLYKQSPLGTIPVEWDVQSIGNLADYYNGNSFKAEEWLLEGLPIIRIQNLNGETEFNFYKGPLEDSWTVRSGDLLFAWAGMRETSFGPRIWEGPTGALNQHIFKVVPRTATISSKKFLFYLLRFHLAEIVKAAHGFKDSFVHITRRELCSISVGLPKPEEQRKIVEALESIDNVVTRNAESLAKLRQLKHGLMHDLLTGRVPVST